MKYYTVYVRLNYIITCSNITVYLMSDCSHKNHTRRKSRTREQTESRQFRVSTSS